MILIYITKIGRMYLTVLIACGKELSWSRK